MSQINGGDGDDLGANDELIAFKDEGDQEEKRNVSAERELDDVKSSLVNQSETNSGSETGRRLKPNLEERRARHSHLFERALRKRQDGGLFQPSPYVGYPIFMIPDIGNLCSPYLTNGTLTPSARTYLPFQWSLLDIPGREAVRDPATSTHLSTNLQLVQHPHMTHFHPLLSYNPEPLSSQRVSPGFSPDTDISRTAHATCYPVSPRGIAQITHPLRWLQGQQVYPIAGGFSPATLANASMPNLVSSSLSPVLVPTPKLSISHPAINPARVKQELEGKNQPGKSLSDIRQEKEDEKKPHIKKPLNAFMLYMREERPKVVAQCKVKESATINQILGQRWHSLTKEKQAKYYELAHKERLLHSKLYPGWSARDNYGKKKKRKRTKSGTEIKVPEEDLPSQLKRPRVLPEETAHRHTLLTQTAQTHPHSYPQQHTISHLTHTHLSQASPASSLDSPATPSTSLASPATPTSTPTDYAHSTYSGQTSFYTEQVLLSVESPSPNPHQTPHPLSQNTIFPEPSAPSSSCDNTSSSLLMATSLCSPTPHLASAHQLAVSSHNQ